MRKLKQTLINFFFVLLHWRKFHDVILTMHQPWFDIVEGSDLLYLSDPANWRCKFCGRPYHDSWINSQKQHHDSCLWPRIERIHPYYRSTGASFTILWCR